MPRSAPFCLITTAAVAWLYPSENRYRPSRLSSWRRLYQSLGQIDFVGFILILTPTALLVTALQEAGSHAVAWDSFLVIFAFFVSAASFAAFCVWEVRLSYSRTTIEPLFPVALLRNRVLVACMM